MSEKVNEHVSIHVSLFLSRWFEMSPSVTARPGSHFSEASLVSLRGIITPTFSCQVLIVLLQNGHVSVFVASCLCLLLKQKVIYKRNK